MITACVPISTALVHVDFDQPFLPPFFPIAPGCMVPF